MQSLKVTSPGVENAVWMLPIPQGLMDRKRDLQSSRVGKQQDLKRGYRSWNLPLAGMTAVLIRPHSYPMRVNC